MSAGKTATPPTAMQRSNVSASAALSATPTTTRSIPARSARRSVRAKPGRARELRDGQRLAGADLEREEGGAALGGLRHQPADHVQPVEPGEQRRGRLVARDLGRQLGAVLDVGRVGDHGVELARRPRAGRRARSATSSPSRAALARATAERVLADVGRRHREVRALVLERERDRAAAGADVDHARARRQPERRLDQRLGLRARDEHARVDLQVEVAKALDAR